jgi:biotin operon repressor
LILRPLKDQADDDAAFQAAQEDGITEADRKMVAVVEFLTTPIGGKPGDEPVSQAKIAENTKMSKSQVSYRVNRLLAAGYLANQETQKGKPHKLAPGAALPDKVPPLPTPGQLSEWLIQNNRADLIIPWNNPISGAFHNCANYLSTQQKISISSSQNRTPDPCLDCPQNEANKQVKEVCSDTNRTPEHPENVNLKSSGRSGEAELPPTSPLAEPTNIGSSAVRSNDSSGIVKNAEKKNPTQMPYEEVID